MVGLSLWLKLSRQFSYRRTFWADFESLSLCLIRRIEEEMCGNDDA